MTREEKQAQLKTVWAAACEKRGTRWSSPCCFQFRGTGRTQCLWQDGGEVAGWDWAREVPPILCFIRRLKRLVLYCLGHHLMQKLKPPVIVEANCYWYIWRHCQPSSFLDLAHWLDKTTYIEEICQALLHGIKFLHCFVYSSCEQISMFISNNSILVILAD